MMVEVQPQSIFMPNFRQNMDGALTFTHVGVHHDKVAEMYYSTMYRACTMFILTECKLKK